MTKTQLKKRIKELEKFRDEAFQAIDDSPFITKKPHLFFPVAQADLLKIKIQHQHIRNVKELIFYYKYYA